jgi:hypothetical protein
MSKDIKSRKIIKGDLNGDNKINAGDLLILRRYILGIIDSIPAGDALEVADLNGDGRIDAGDYSILRRYLMGANTSFIKR